MRRAGETQALSNFATKELAEEAARKQGAVEDQSGDADAVDVRENVFSEGPEEDLDAKRTLLGTGAVALGVIVLIIVISLLVSITDFGG